MSSIDAWCFFTFLLSGRPLRSLLYSSCSSICLSIDFSGFVSFIFLRANCCFCPEINCYTNCWWLGWFCVTGCWKVQWIAWALLGCTCVKVVWLLWLIFGCTKVSIQVPCSILPILLDCRCFYGWSDLILWCYAFAKGMRVLLALDIFLTTEFDASTYPFDASFSFNTFTSFLDLPLGNLTCYRFCCV